MFVLQTATANSETIVNLLTATTSWSTKRCLTECTSLSSSFISRCLLTECMASRCTIHSSSSHSRSQCLRCPRWWCRLHHSSTIHSSPSNNSSKMRCSKWCSSSTMWPSTTITDLQRMKWEIRNPNHRNNSRMSLRSKKRNKKINKSGPVYSIEFKQY